MSSDLRKPPRPAIRYRPGVPKPARPTTGAQRDSARQFADTFIVQDNWPALIPVTAAEIAVIETYFPTLLDELATGTPRARGKGMDGPA